MHNVWGWYVALLDARAATPEPLGINPQGRDPGAAPLASPQAPLGQAVALAGPQARNVFLEMMMNQ